MNASDLMTPEPVVVNEQTSLAECAHLLWRHRFRHLPVVDREGRLSGVVTDFGVFQRGGLAGAEGELWVPFDETDEGLRADDVAESPAVVVQLDDPLERVLRQLADDPVDVAIVVDADHHPVGVISEHDGVRMAQDLDDLLVREEHISSTPVITVRADDPAQAAWALVLEGRVRHVVVVDGGKLFGVISARDLIEDDVPRGRELTCREVVRQLDVIARRQGTPIDEIAQTMAEEKIGCVPLVDEQQRPVAVVTRTDILDLVAQTLQDEDLFGVE